MAAACARSENETKYSVHKQKHLHGIQLLLQPARDIQVYDVPIDHWYTRTPYIEEQVHGAQLLTQPARDIQVYDVPIGMVLIQKYGYLMSKCSSRELFVARGNRVPRLWYQVSDKSYSLVKYSCLGCFVGQHSPLVFAPFPLAP